MDIIDIHNFSNFTKHFKLTPMLLLISLNCFDWLTLKITLKNIIYLLKILFYCDVCMVLPQVLVDRNEVGFFVILEHLIELH